MSSPFLYYSFILFVYILKIIFIILSVWRLYLKRKNPKSLMLDKISFYRERIEFIFVICMAILLLFVFYPGNKKITIDSHTQFLIYLFGIILLLTAKWKIFFNESPLISDTQQIFGQTANQ